LGEKQWSPFFSRSCLFSPRTVAPKQKKEEEKITITNKKALMTDVVQHIDAFRKIPNLWALCVATTDESGATRRFTRVFQALA